MQAEFKINIKAYWNKSGKFEVIQNDENTQNEKMDSDGNNIEEESEEEADEDEPQKKKRIK
jgi:hypothetical protein